MKYLLTSLLAISPFLFFGQTSDNPWGITLSSSTPATEQVIFGDFDNDGVDEKIVVTKEAMATVGFVYYYHDTYLQEPETIGIFSSPSTAKLTVLKMDADNDRDLDLIVSARDHAYENGEATIYKFMNQGDGSFKPVLKF